VQHPHPRRRVDAGLSALELDRTRRLGICPCGEHSCRAALFFEGEADGRALRRAHHGRRRSPAARARREAASGARALPDAWLLSVDRRNRICRRDAGRHHRGNACCDHFRAPGAPDRQRRSRLDGEEEAGGVLLMNQTAMARLVNQTAIAPLLPTLRFLTCGSVDDGKSTLIGRLLYEKKLIFDDQLSALERDSKKCGTTEDEIDFALLVDGLEAEREQGITIDVAYRYFATPARSFIVADAPGHEQYTRNMATGASNA